MSTPFQPTMHNNYFRNSPLTVDTHHKFFDEDESNILDDNILEHNHDNGLDSGLEMSPPMDGSRRQSFAVSSTMFSPKPEEWQQHAVDMQATTSSHGYNNNPFIEHSNNPFMRLDQQQAAAYGQQPFGWPMVNGSGSCTPMQPHDGLPTEFDGALQYRPMPNQTPFSNPATTHVPLFSQASSESMPTSPDKHWMGPESLDHQGMSKRMRPHSPMLRSHSPLMRRDGIRKKNARFEIPAERNLLNIDQLIAHSTDEQEIKELKQQKRLLRNRQAALDSRQRKKQHTERLEDEKKHYTVLINELEDELGETKLALQQQASDLHQKEAQYQQYIEGLLLEKEEMLRNHTLETGDLRKKVSVLSEHIKQIENTAMSAVPSSTGFSSAEFSDIDALAMDGAWESISFLDDFLEHDVKSETTIVPAKKATNAMASEEKPAAHGLLLMLLLCGALVASRGSTPSIPKMSDDVRAASATILDDIFKDAGVQNNQASASIVEAGAPSATGASWSSTPSTALVANNKMVGVSSSMLEDLADQLAQPSEQQQNEQLFSLSAAQYEGLTSHDFLRNSPSQGQAAPQHRRNLAESLAAMRRNSKDSAAEVYTRSLLWDQVPSDVVRNFAKLVAECNPSTNECDTSG